ncbi:hypothetical protein BDZ89DRAFT_506109 [Hymenopellis radicata]|nr:hypothetical protein BDZ89DRAFT_506109 [Hymenopellis radicata]
MVSPVWCDSGAYVQGHQGTACRYLVGQRHWHLHVHGCIESVRNTRPLFVGSSDTCHLIKKTNPSAVLISAQVARAAKETEDLLNADAETAMPAFFSAPAYLELVDGPVPSVIPPKYTEFKYGDRDSLILHSSGTTDWSTEADILCSCIHVDLCEQP